MYSKPLRSLFPISILIFQNSISVFESSDFYSYLIKPNEIIK